MSCKIILHPPVKSSKHASEIISRRGYTQTGIQQWHPESESTLGLQQTQFIYKKNACRGRHHEKASQT